MSGNERAADSHGRKTFRFKVGERVEVAERLGHFRAVDHQVRGVKPVPREGAVPPAGAFRLRDFVFVVREAQVDAAAVQVEGFAEIMRAHRGALDVPARTAFAPRAVPEIRPVFGLARLPQREVGDVFARVFVRGVDFSGGVRRLRAQRVAVEVRELSVVGIGGNFEVDRAVRRDVGVPARDELFDHRDLQRDVRDGGGFGVRREHVQRGAVVVEFFRPDGGEFRKRFSLFLRAADRFVVHVGDVADVAHAQAVLLERAAQDVLQKECAEIADVRGPVDRRAAAVHAEFFSGSARRERAHGAGQRIV